TTAPGRAGPATGRPARRTSLARSSIRTATPHAGLLGGPPVGRGSRAGTAWPAWPVSLLGARPAGVRPWADPIVGLTGRAGLPAAPATRRRSATGPIVSLTAAATPPARRRSSVRRVVGLAAPASPPARRRPRVRAGRR